MRHLQEAYAEQENRMTTQLNRLGGGKYIEKNPLSFNGGCSDLRSLLRSETHCTVLSLWSDEITSHPCSTLSSRTWVVGQVNHPYVSSNLCIAALNVSLCWESRTDTIPWVADLPSLWGQGRSFVWRPSEHASRRGGQQLSPLKRGGGHHCRGRLANLLVFQMAYNVLIRI